MNYFSLQFGEGQGFETLWDYRSENSLFWLFLRPQMDGKACGMFARRAALVLGSKKPHLGSVDAVRERSGWTAADLYFSL
jgi:hypothetical protein